MVVLGHLWALGLSIDAGADGMLVEPIRPQSLAVMAEYISEYCCFLAEYSGKAVGVCAAHHLYWPAQMDLDGRQKQKPGGLGYI